MSHTIHHRDFTARVYITVESDSEEEATELVSQLLDRIAEDTCEVDLYDIEESD